MAHKTRKRLRPEQRLGIVALAELSDHAAPLLGALEVGSHDLKF